MSSKGASATAQESVKRAKENLSRFLRKMDTVPQEELQHSAQVIYNEAVALTPYKTGKLEGSVYARVSNDKRRGGIVAGASARSSRGYNYAGIQHENENFNHPKKGQAHYISEPFEKETERLKERLRSKVRYEQK